MLPRVYALLLLAIAKRNNGRCLEAQEHLREALDLALPDQVYLPFAQLTGMENFLSELNIRSLHCENSQAAESNPALGGGSLSAIKLLCKRQQNGVCIIKKAILQKKSPLTPREREIALFAKERLSSQEIADRLFISKTTVKTILRNVYRKLDIHSRAELSSREF